MRIAVAAALAIVTLVPCAYGQTWHEPYRQAGTAGATLEDIYERGLRLCGIPQLKKIVQILRKVELSNVPPVLQISIKDLDGQVLYQREQSAQRLLLYAFDSGDVGRGTSFSQDRYIELNTDLDALPYVPSGFAQVGYSHNCNRIVSLATDMKLNIPGDIVNAANSASSDERRATAIVLVDGRFVSPLYVALNSTGPQKTEAAIALWEWYDRNGTAIQPWYMRSFNGFAYYLINTTTTAKGETFSLGGSTATPIFQIGAKIKAQLGTQDTLRIKDLGSAIRMRSTTQAAVDSARIPPLDSVVAMFASTLAAEDATGASILVPNRITNFTRSIAGVPERLCDSNLWEFVSLHHQGMSLNGGQIINGKCVLTVRYLAAAAIADSANVTVDEAMALRKSVAGKRAMVAVQPTVLTTTKAPIISLLDGTVILPKAKYQAVGPTSVLAGLQWTAQYKVADSDFKVDLGTTVVDSVKIQCATEDKRDITLEVSSSSMGAEKRLTLLATTPWSNAESAKDALDKGQGLSCALRTWINISSISTPVATVKRALSASVVWPAPPPKAPAVPAATP